MELSDLVNELGNTGLSGEDENKELELNNPITFKTSTEFLKDFGISDDVEDDVVGMNLCVYYSIREHKDEETGEYLGTFFGEFLILHQRRGTISSIFVELLKEEDTKGLHSYLEKHWVRNVRYWRSID